MRLPVNRRPQQTRRGARRATLTATDGRAVTDPNRGAVFRSRDGQLRTGVTGLRFLIATAYDAGDRHASRELEGFPAPVAHFLPRVPVARDDAHQGSALASVRVARAERQRRRSAAEADEHEDSPRPRSARA